MVPRGTEAVVFSIDGSFLAAYSLRAVDPKIRGGAVDVVRLPDLLTKFCFSKIHHPIFIGFTYILTERFIHSSFNQLVNQSMNSFIIYFINSFFCSIIRPFFRSFIYFVIQKLFESFILLFVRFLFLIYAFIHSFLHTTFFI